MGTEERGRCGAGAAGEPQVSGGSGTRPPAFGVGGGRGARSGESGIDGVTQVTEGRGENPEVKQVFVGVED